MAGNGTNAPPGGAESRRVAGLGRLENGLRQAGDWYHWGPYLSERQWGTVREDYSAHGTAWEYLPHDHARSRAYRWGEDGLAGFSRRRAAALPRARALERARPDPEGAHLRADREPGQPRRGRQGVLVVPRRNAEPLLESLALPLSAGCVPVRAARRGERSARQAGPRVRAARHRRSSTTTATGSSRPTTRRPAPTTCSSTVRVTNAGPDADDAPRAADRVVPEHVGLRGRRGEAGAQGRGRRSDDRAPVPRALELVADAAPDGSRAGARSSATTRRTTSGSSAARARVPEGRHQRPRRLGLRLGQPRWVRHEGGVLVSRRGRPGRRRSSCACGCAAAG